jgi:beta-lactamase regulating signal transducer with metallopeptidase domain
LVYVDIAAAGNGLFRLPGAEKILPFIAVLYLIILLIYSFRFGRAYRSLGFVSRKGLLKAPVDVRIFTTGTALHLGIKKNVQVWLTNNIDVPSVTGFIKPVILLPAAIMTHLSTEQVNAILLHELAHIKRNDFLLNLIQSVIALLLFFNPFVYWLNNIAKKERENCCDDWVLNFRYNQFDYAKALLVLEEQRQTQILLVMSATDNEKKLLQRIKRLFSPQRQATTTGLFQKFQLSGLTVLLFSAIYLFTALSNNHVYRTKTATTAVRKVAFEGSIQNVSNVISTPAYTIPIIAGSAAAKLTHQKNDIKKIAAVKRRFVISDTEFVLAMVNKDAVVSENQPEESNVTAVSNGVKDSVRSVFVKVEEEESGKSQRNTYYFNLKNNKGNTYIKPLLIIKKYKAKLQKNTLKSYKGKQRIST